MFGKEAGSKVAQKVSKVVTSDVFSAANLLRSVDTHGGALNDSAIHQYAKIERESGLTDMKRGGSMLHHRSRPTEIRNIANHWTKKVLNVTHDPYCPAGDLVKLDPERVLQVALASYGLLEKAQSTGISLASCCEQDQTLASCNRENGQRKRSQRLDLPRSRRSSLWVLPPVDCCHMHVESRLYDWGSGFVLGLQNCHL